MTNHRPKPLLSHTVDLTAADMNILCAACNMLDRLFSAVENVDNQRRISKINESLVNLINDLDSCAKEISEDDEEIKGMIIEFIEADGRVFKKEDK